MVVVVVIGLIGLMEGGSGVDGGGCEGIVVVDVVAAAAVVIIIGVVVATVVVAPMSSIPISMAPFLHTAPFPPSPYSYPRISTVDAKRVLVFV